MRSKSEASTVGLVGCRACGSAAMREVQGYASLPRVTSDCTPFREGGQLFVCHDCGAGQAIPDDRWRREVDEIYSKYDIYHQAAGAEQHVLDGSGNYMRPRSEVLRERLSATAGVPRAGRLLDVGCGNGATLSAFSKPGGWELHGLEIHDRNQARLSAIRGFQQLHTNAPGDVPGTFDLITLVHTLEHFADPAELLRQLKPKLADRGVLFVQVPDAAANPFDQVVADHLLHFTPYSLRVLIRAAGFERTQIYTDWVKKELSLLAFRQESGGGAENREGSVWEPAAVEAQIVWLGQVIESAKQAAKKASSYGLFGSSIAATWLFASVAEAVDFFVDEDPGRVGRSHLGRPILKPTEVPGGSTVFMPLAPVLARSIMRRLSHLPFTLYGPPLPIELP